MTPAQLEESIERTATRTAEKMEERFNNVLSSLGFNMDPDHRHDEQQFIAFARNMHKGTWAAFKGIVLAVLTALGGWIVYQFIGGRPH